MRILRNIVIVIIFLAVGLFLGKDLIARYIVKQQVQSATGLPVRIQSLDMGLFDTNIRIRDLRLLNPPEFREDVMAEIPEIYVDYELTPLLTGKMNFSEIRFYLSEVNVVRNEDGKVNVETLKPVQDKRGKSAEAQPREAGRLPDRIDLLELRIGQVHYIDHTVSGGEPRVQNFNVNFQETYRDITDIREVVNLVAGQILTRTAIRGALQDLDLDQLEDSVRDIVPSTQDIRKGAEGAVQEQIEKATDRFKNIF